MINISTKLDERAVVAAGVIGDKTALFTEIGRIAAESYGLDPAIVVDRLEERERLVAEARAPPAEHPRAGLLLLACVGRSLLRTK